ncbi:hypothetical protein BD626DRAFT_567619 [Schizophyllum amplum]|uniref:Rieske domain-containing protein n=1 Tax=Schizophyllum amplum TaxID=97359 RepID=A0A550CIZ5_9AGAR|nr:hypothetical protein BD626DRAFT_567619 [Auriculariopsis ampla]
MATTKTIAVLNDADLKDGQMKEVEFESGKVLVTRLGDKVHATSVFCTHYGAPLAKGVLTSNGRVVCPWHGACFNVCTGDIEDAPAPTAIHSFRAEAKDGKIYVTADPSKTTKDEKERAPKLLSSGTEGSGKGVVIIGGGSATYHAIESLREHGYPHPITVLSKEPHMPIDRTKLSKALITDASKLEWRNASDLKLRYNANFRISTTATSINFPFKTITLENGETVEYDKLILATGGQPKSLPIEGADLENVYTFRGVEDAKKIDKAAQEGKNFVVIGSSFIGMEIVGAVAKRKLASIDVISMDEFPFEANLGKEVGAGLKKYYEGQGAKFHMQASIEKIEGSDGKATAVILKGGERVPADFVLMAVGVAPVTQILKQSLLQQEQSSVELEKDGSVKVDEYLRVPGLQDVYAVGDIAMYPYKGEYRRIEHWNVAGNHGRAVGKTIAGSPQPFLKVPVFWSGQGVRYCGLGAKFDEVILQGDPSSKFVAFYVQSGKIVAVASMKTDPVVSHCSELLRLELMPSPEEIKAGKDVLSVDISTVGSRARVGA